MGIEKIGTTIGKEIIVWSRTSSKSLLASRPIKINTRELKYVPKLEGDLVQISKNSKIIIPEDKQLFPWATKKPALTFDNINPESLALVHMTNDFPKMGEVLSCSAMKDASGLAYPRSTIHFTLNRSVTEDALFGRKWKTMDYAVIAPFKETLNNLPSSKIIGGIQEDFILLDKVKLPKGSVIVKYNPSIPNQQLCVSDIFDGIKLIETSNREIGSVADLVVEKMGYSTSKKALKEFLALKNTETLPFIDCDTPNEETIRYFIRRINQEHGGIKKLIKELEDNLKFNKKCLSTEDDEMLAFRLQENIVRCEQSIEKYKILEKYFNKLEKYEKSWSDFCKKNNYIYKKPSETSYAKLDATISLIYAVENLNKNSWGNAYKERILNILNEALKAYPQDKFMCTDYKKVKEIIEEAKTPQNAIQKIKNELKIKSSNQIFGSSELDQIIEQQEIYLKYL